MSITWNTGLAAERARFNRNRKLDLLIARHWKLKKKKRPAARAASSKRQAPSSKPRPALMMPQLKDINNLERNI